MNKHCRITRQELCAKVLAAIRERPDCHGVSEVAITSENVVDVGMTWHVTIVDSGDVPVELAYRVARSVQEQLSLLFELID